MSARMFLFFVLSSLYLHNVMGVVPHHDFIVVTPEKTGTHLLTKALEQLLDMKVVNCWEHEISRKALLTLLKETKKRGEFFQIHANPKNSLIMALLEMDYKVIFLMRDPRDQAVSLYYYIRDGWKYGHLNTASAYGRLSAEDQLEEIITGKRFGTSGTLNIIGKNLRWMRLVPSFVFTAHFENLVGDEGGGFRELQIEEMRKIASHLELDLSDSEIEERSLGLFGKPGEKTFRNGQIGSWKTHFLPKHIRAFKKLFGKKLIKLGYEEDADWGNL